MLMASALCWGAGRPGRVAIDAKDVELREVLRLIAAQGGPQLVPHPDVAKEAVTFAVKGVSPGAAVRWLCRACRLVVVAKKSRLVVGRPPLDEPVAKDYRVAKLAPTATAAEALVNFVEKVIFATHPNRVRNKEGELEPLLEAACAKGRLRVLAPRVVHREVLALLRAMSRAKKPRSFEALHVSYRSHELGLLGPHSGREPRPLKGEVEVDLGDATAYEAAWALTSGSKVSFFVDPWDKKLRETRVTLGAKKLGLAAAAHSLAQQLGAERCWYDEAWVFVREPRQPLFENFLVRAYNVSGGPFRGALAGWIERLAKQQVVRGELPSSADRVGDRLLVAAPAPRHAPLEELLRRRIPGGFRP